MPDDIVDFVSWKRQQDRSTISSVMDGIDGDPDDAAKAYNLSKETGDPAPIISVDTKAYEDNLKKRVSAEVVARNDILRQWAERNPSAPGVAADDWHNLDDFDSKLKNMSDTLPGSKAQLRAMNAFVQGFKEHFDTGPLVREAAGFHPLSQLAWIGTMGLFVELPSRLMAAGLGGSYEALKETVGPQVARDVVGYAEGLMSRGGWEGLHTPGGAAAVQAVVSATKAVKPFVAAGKEPPLGVDPLVDAARAEAAKGDQRSLKEVEKAVDATNTQERAPELMADLARLRAAGVNIELDQEAALALYGGKKPSPGDGKLGDVRNIDEQLAAPDSGRISIPIEDWLTKVSKETRDALEDKVTPRAGGFTPEEAREVKPVPPEPVEQFPDQTDAGRLAHAEAMVRKATKIDSPIARREAPFEPSAIMPKERQERYMKAWDDEFNERQERLLKKAQDQVTKEKSASWMEAAAEGLPEVEKLVDSSPDWQAYNLFRKGEYQGIKIGKMKIDSDYLTSNQKAQLPKDFYKKGGTHPDFAASIVGMGDGDELISRMIEFNRQKGDLGPKEYRDLMIGQELRRRLEKELGISDEAILEEAQDHVYGDKQLALLHEDTIAMAELAKQQVPFTKEDVVRQNQERFDRMLMRHANYDKTNNALYRAGGKLEDALLKEKYGEAYQRSVQKENAHALGKMIKVLNREVKSFDRLAKMYAKREVPKRDPTTTNFIHDLLNRIDETTRRTPQDIAREINYWGNDLRKHVEQITNDGHIVSIPEFLYDSSWSKPIADMTTEEFRGVRDAIVSLDKYSKSTKEQWVAGELRDYDETVSHMVNVIKSKPQEALGKWMPKVSKTYWAQSIQLEAYLNRLDQGNAFGIFNQAIVRDYTEAVNRADAMDKVYGRMIGELSPIEDPYIGVKQDIFRDPRTGDPIEFTRMQILAILQNMGNPGNFYGVLDGYKVPRIRAQDVVDLVKRNLRPGDIERAQALGAIFEKAKAASDNMYRHESGIAPTRIDLWKPGDNPLGQLGITSEGWYYPIIHDKDLPQKNPAIAGPSPIETPYWTRSTLPAANYTKQRTGYVGPYLLEMDGFQHRLQQMVRDTELRPTLTRLNKLFRDDRIVNAIKKQAGEEVSNLLDPFLKDLAGTREHMDANSSALNKVMSHVIKNAMFYLVGLNPVTLGKHTLTAAYNSINEVGIRGLSKQFATLLQRDPETTETNWSFAINKSEELQRRLRHFQETITANFDRTYGDLQVAGDMKDFLTNWKFAKGKIMRFRDALHYVGSAPLAFFDQLSAVPTWLAIYRKSIEAGIDEGQAVFLADRGVRRAHGSTAITNRPGFIRSNALGGLFTPFYGFFNHILMKQYETAWAARAALRGDGYYVEPPIVNRETMDIQPPEVRDARPSRERMEEMEAEYKKTDAFKNGAALIPTLSGMIVSYFIIPSLVEELIQPQNKEKGWGPAKKQTWLSYLTHMEARGLSGSFLGVRDFVHSGLEGQDPSAGLVGAIGRPLYNTVKDIEKMPFRDSKQMFKFIKDSNGSTNILTGIGAPNAVVRTGVFGANWYMGKEKPKGFAEWWSGLVTSGTAHPRH